MKKSTRQVRSSQTIGATTRLFKLIPLLLGVTLVVATLIFFNFNRASIYNELATLDLVPKPEKLTELYFDDSANLPSTAKSNQVINFAFVIHNLETTDYQYIYRVSLIANGMMLLVDSGKVSVKNDQYYVKKEQIRLLSSTGGQEVVVELTNKQQSIHFWIGR